MTLSMSTLSPCRNTLQGCAASLATFGSGWVVGTAHSDATRSANAHTAANRGALPFAAAGQQRAPLGERIADRHACAQLGVGSLRMMISCAMWSAARAK
jgi:hypothetical protein